MRCGWAPRKSPPGTTPASASTKGSARHQLLKGLDGSKDQSYFLHRLTQAQLSKASFPVGELRKTEVRRIAAEIGLPVAHKRDSTGICFIGERPFREFLNRYLANQPGPIEDDRGRVIGEHVGLSFYTIGQRKGIGIGGLKSHRLRDGDHEPWFVARKDLDRNVLIVVQGHDHPWLLSSALVADDASWIAGAAPDDGAYAAKTRYRQADARCRLSVREGGAFALAFAAPQWAVTPGQSAVLYDGDVCLGGGVIGIGERRMQSPHDDASIDACCGDGCRAAGRRHGALKRDTPLRVSTYSAPSMPTSMSTGLSLTLPNAYAALSLSRSRRPMKRVTKSAKK